MEEIWKDVVGYEGLYQISSKGRLKSCGGVWKVGNTGGFRKERIVNSSINRYGYLRFILCDRNKKRKHVMIHRLVAEAFIPNPDNKPIVNHLDENKTNNCVENLEWATAKENINWGTSLRKRADTQKNTQKTKPVLQFDKNDTFIKRYPSCREAARQLNIDRSGIAHCCHKCKNFSTYKGYKWYFEEDYKP